MAMESEGAEMGTDGSSVRDGPPATRPTPMVTSTMPAQRCRADVLMQPEVAEQGHEHVSDGSGRKDVGEIGEGERGHVAGHEAEQGEDSEDDPGIGQGGENMREMMHVDGADIFHAARQKGVPDGAEDDDRKQDEVFAKRQSAIPEPW